MSSPKLSPLRSEFDRAQAGDHAGHDGAGHVPDHGVQAHAEVDQHQRIVFVNYFSNAEGEKTRHFMNPEWPLEVQSTLTFVEDGDQTLIHLEGGPINAQPHEEDLYYENLESMRIGFSGTFAQLDDYLATR